VHLKGGLSLLRRDVQGSLDFRFRPLSVRRRRSLAVFSYLSPRLWDHNKTLARTPPPYATFGSFDKHFCPSGGSPHSGTLTHPPPCACQLPASVGLASVDNGFCCQRAYLVLVWFSSGRRPLANRPPCACPRVWVADKVARTLPPFPLLFNPPPPIRLHACFADSSLMFFTRRPDLRRSGVLTLAVIAKVVFPRRFYLLVWHTFSIPNLSPLNQSFLPSLWSSACLLIYSDS